MTSGPITSCQIDGKKVETVTDFLFLVSKISVDGDCSHDIKKKCLLLGRKVMTSLGSILKSRDITLLKGLFSQSYGLSSNLVQCESRTIKKTEARRTGALKLCCWRRLLRVSWPVRSHQSILKEISPEYSL